MEDIEYETKVVVEEVNLYTKVDLMNLRPLCLLAVVRISQTSRGTVTAPIGRIVVAAFNFCEVTETLA